MIKSLAFAIIITDRFWNQESGNRLPMITSSTADLRAADNLHSLQRSVKVLVSALAILLLTGNARVSAKTTELSEAQLTSKLADPASGLCGIVDMIEQAMITGEMWPVEELIDHDTILTRATDGVSVAGAKTIKALFSDSTLQAWQQNGITKDFAGTNFRFLRARTFKNRAGLLFRSVGENHALNFFSFTVSETSAKNFRITDIYTAGLNEYTSETLRRTYLHLVASLSGEEGRALSADHGAFADSLEEIAAMSQLLKNSQWREVLDAAAALPPAVQRDRSVLLIRLEAAENYSVTSRAAVLEDWLAAYPDEMSLPLKLADHYIIQERWDDAERVVTQLLASTGGDARLKLQLGNINWRRDRDKRLATASVSKN